MIEKMKATDMQVGLVHLPITSNDVSRSCYSALLGNYFRACDVLDLFLSGSLKFETNGQLSLDSVHWFDDLTDVVEFLETTNRILSSRDTVPNESTHDQ